MLREGLVYGYFGQDTFDCRFAVDTLQSSDTLSQPFFSEYVVNNIDLASPGFDDRGKIEIRHQELCAHIE